MSPGQEPLDNSLMWDLLYYKCEIPFNRFSNGSVVAGFLFTSKENVPDQVSKVLRF